MMPKIGNSYNLSLPKIINDEGLLADLDNQELCPTDLDHQIWDSSVTGKPVKVYDLMVGFPEGRAYALVNFDEPWQTLSSFDIMVPIQWLSEIPSPIKLCSCDMAVIIARGCQCGGS